MGRTSKLSRKFDMILVAILLIGMLMVLLYLAGRYECGEGIALIIGGVFVIIIGLCFFRNTVIIRYKKNGLVATRDEEVCLCGTEVVIEEDKLRQNIIIKALELKKLAYKVDNQVKKDINDVIDPKKCYQRSSNKFDLVRTVYPILSAIHSEMQDIEKVFNDIQNLYTLLKKESELSTFINARNAILNFQNSIDNVWSKASNYLKEYQKYKDENCRTNKLVLGKLFCRGKNNAKLEDQATEVIGCLRLNFDFDIDPIIVLVKLLVEIFNVSKEWITRYKLSMSQLVLITIGLLMIGMGVCRVCSFQKEIDQVGKDDSIVINDGTMIVNRNSGGTSFIIVEKQKEFQDSILNVCLDIKEMLQKNYQIVSDIQKKVTGMSEKESSSVAYDLKKKIGTILTEINVLQKQVEQIQDTLVVQEQSPMNNQGIQLFGSKLSDNIHININTLVEKANEMDAKVRSLQDKIDK